MEKLFQKDYFDKFHTQRESDTLSQSTNNKQTTPRQGKGQMVSKPPLSIDIDEDARGSKSLIYKPENKGNGLQNYSSQANKPAGKPGKSPITLQLTEIIEKFKPSFVEESHD